MCKSFRPAIDNQQRQDSDGEAQGKDSQGCGSDKESQAEELGAKKVKGILKNFHCNKPRCYFSQQQNAEYEGAVETLWLKKESIYFRYSCGD